MEDAAIQGHLILLMAPSGSGKKKVIDGLGDVAEQIYFAKTFTSREPRDGTEENPKYIFISRAEFESMIANDEFIEWAEFSANLYGTPKSEFLIPLQAGRVVMKEMEMQGVQQIKSLLPKEKCTVVYIDAGSWENLKGRILSRAPISKEHLALRKQRFEEESKFKAQADVIIDNRNGKLDEAQAVFRQVVTDIVNENTN
ncbi:hypothetical protein CL653_03030 [bacterium]|nr:hypothetical protein [bacterium]|tara:strand:- start:516 stop:1112 length:597 start_codon:yes stop_codon:yes gene_type:complete